MRSESRLTAKTALALSGFFYLTWQSVKAKMPWAAEQKRMGFLPEPENLSAGKKFRCRAVWRRATVSHLGCLG